MIARSLTIHDITTSKKKNRHWKIKNAFVYSHAFLVHRLFILIHILFFTTPTTFSLSCLTFFLFFILFPFLFFIQCPSPYPPQPHTKHAVIAIAKKKKKEKHSQPPTTMHAHTTQCPLLPLSPSLLFNQHVFFVHAWLCCVFICTAHASAGARLVQQKTRNKKQKRSGAMNALHGWHKGQRWPLERGAQHAQYAHTGMEE